MILFFGGFFLAELDIRRRSSSSSSSSSNNNTINTSDGPIWSTLYILSFLTAIYLGGQPNRLADSAPGWSFLTSLVPSNFADKKQRYWTSWSGLLLVWSTSNHPLLQKCFTNSLSQYLGKVSFSLYLVHGAVIHTLGYAALELFWRWGGRETYLQRECGFLLAAVCVVGVVVWLADLFMRLVDVPTVRLARWIENKCLVKRESVLEHVTRRDSGKLV
jgi:peptidoglycan/LPS O-acetylase OafA/YrhL